MNSDSLAAIIRSAATTLHAPAPVKKTFTVLLGAYLNNKEIDKEENLYVNKQDEDDDVRSRITALRTALKGTIFRFPDKGPCELEVPYGRPYALRKAPTTSLSLLWEPHIHHKEDVLIQTYERLFFRHKTTYVRDLKVNRVEDIGKIASIVSLPVDELSPSMHYVSSGELRAAITLQKFFVDGRKRAQLNSGPVFSGDSRHNLILLGAARVEEAYFTDPSYEEYRIVDGGVRPGFNDKRERHRHVRTVHVLMSRRHSTQKSSVLTVFESSHGRAIDGVCIQLAQADSNLCEYIVAQLGKQAELLPDLLFQVVFSVALVSNAQYVTSASQVEVVGVRAYPMPAEKTQRTEGSHKSAGKRGALPD